MFAKVPIYSFPVNYALTFYGLMDSLFLLDAINLGWSIIYIEAIILKYNCISFSEDHLCLSKQCIP